MHLLHHATMCFTAVRQAVQESLEELQALLKSKDTELQRVMDKTAEFQTRLERLSQVLKQQDDGK